MTRRATAVVALLAFTAIAAPAGGARGATLVVSAPETLAGDGRARGTISIALAAQGKLPAPRDLAVMVDAGSLGPARATDDRVELDYFAPRLLDETSVTVRVSGRLDRRLSGSATIRIVPPSEPLQERATGGAYDLRTPARFILGRHASTTISLRVPAGSPPPELHASVGTLSPLEPGQDGRLRATWTPPEKKFPQLAIFAALSTDGVTLDWAAVPLYGQGKVETHTVKNASVRIRIGDEEYGPVRTDAKGNAAITIAAPPGVNRGVTVATSEIGGTTEAPLDLSPPPSSRLLAVCGRGDRVHLLTVDAVGAPATGDALELASDDGTLGEPETSAPGHRVASFTPRDDAREAQVNATLAGDAASRSRCRTAVPGELPDRIDVAFDRDESTAGSGPVTVGVRLRFPGARWRAEARVTATADFGAIGEIAPGADGSLVASWLLPDAHEGRVTATVTVAVEGAPGVVGRKSIALRAGPPASVTLSASKRRLRADGATTTVVSARVADRFGNPVDGARVSARARGSVGAFSAAGPGSYSASYRAPREHERSIDTIDVVVDDGAAWARLPIDLLAARRLLSVGARVGYLTNLGNVDAPLVAADLALRLPFLGERVAVGVDVGWYASTRTDDAMDEPVEILVTAIPIVARITYGVVLDPIDLFAGGAAGVALARAGLRSPSTGERIEGGGRPLLGGLLGGTVAVGPGRLVVEAAYWYAPAGGTHVEGNLAGLSLTLGYRLEL